MGRVGGQIGPIVSQERERERYGPGRRERKLGQGESGKRRRAAGLK
jgi:hypothetical protein